MSLLDSPDVEISIASYYGLLFAEEKDASQIEKILSLNWLSDKKKRQFLRWLS